MLKEYFFVLKYIIFFILISALIYLFNKHTSDLKKIELQSLIIKSQQESFDKIQKQIKLNEDIIKKSNDEKINLTERVDHEKKLYERYFKIYSNDCSGKFIPNSVVKRLREQARDTNKDNSKTSSSIPLVPNSNKSN